MRRSDIFKSLAEVPVLLGNKVRIRQKCISDAANDYSWRTDTELCRLDAAIPSLLSFEEYLKLYAEELRYPSQGRRFAIETMDGKHIGNCSYFNIDETRKDSEFGIMIGDRDYWNQSYGTDAIQTLIKHVFLHTNLERIYLKTLNWNIRAQKCFEKCGFAPQGQLFYGEYSFIIMEIHRKDQLYIDNERYQNDNQEEN